MFYTLTLINKNDNLAEEIDFDEAEECIEYVQTLIDEENTQSNVYEFISLLISDGTDEILTDEDLFEARRVLEEHISEETGENQ